MMGMIILTEDINETIKDVASIIEYRCNNLLKTKSLLEQDMKELHNAQSVRTREKICENIYIKIEYLEILLSKCIDDIITLEIIELDNIESTIQQIPQLSTTKDDIYHSYQ
jgi:hypothetical protein